jgi:hypothetical protein
MSVQPASTLVSTFPETLDDHKHNLQITREAFLEELAKPHGEPHAGRWSALEIAYHVHIIERGVVRGLQKKLASLEKPAPPALQDEIRGQWRHNHAGFINRAIKLTAPDAVLPLNPPSMEDVLTLLAESRSGLLTVIDSSSYDELAAVTMPHPIFGRMNGQLWLDMVAQHEARHIEQMQELRL